MGVTPRNFHLITFDLFHCPIQEYIWFGGGDLDRLQVVNQEGVGAPPRLFLLISFLLFYCPLQQYIWFRGGDLDRLKVFQQEGVG